MHDLQAGIVFPQTEIGADPGAIRAFAQAAESLEFDGLMIYDHVVGAELTNRPDWSGWYDNQHLFHEVFVVLGYMAAITSQIRLVTGILILPQRQTALVAKQAAEVDVLSGGRLGLGIGVGWNDVEFVALNESFGNRGRRCEEQIEVMRALWTEESVDFSGCYHRLPEVGIKPLPVQRPIPVLVGGEADPVLRRAARLGDGWLPMGGVEQAKPKLDRLLVHLEEAGREPTSFELMCTVSLEGRNFDDVYTELESWRGLGATSVYLDTMGSGLTGPEAHIEAATRFRSLFHQ